MRGLADLWTSYRLRWKRRRLIWRAVRARHALTPCADRTAAIRPGMILGFMCLRNETLRLPHLLSHYRALGVGHFLVITHDSTDGSNDWLLTQPDVSLWQAGSSYRASRFGMDWINWLLFRHGHGHWCLTVDADELAVLPYGPEMTLPALTDRLDARGRATFGTLMVDLYPQGRISETAYTPGDNPVDAVPWFDPGPYSVTWHAASRSRLMQGGARARVFHSDQPRRAPTLNKIPLVRWNRRFAYLNGTHTLLPRRLNNASADAPTGVLLHTKFLPDAVARAVEEKARREHFNDPDAFAAYYDALAADPVLWTPGSRRYAGWQTLVAAGLMSAGDLDPA